MIIYNKVKKTFDYPAKVSIAKERLIYIALVARIKIIFVPYAFLIVLFIIIVEQCIKIKLKDFKDKIFNVKNPIYGIKKISKIIPNMGFIYA